MRLACTGVGSWSSYFVILGGDQVSLHGRGFMDGNGHRCAGHGGLAPAGVGSWCRGRSADLDGAG